MKTAAVGQPTFTRWLLTVAVLGTWSAACLWLAQQHASLAWLAGPLFVVPLASLGEWLMHGVIYHGRIPGLDFIRVIHQSGHHSALFPPRRYVWSGPYEFMRTRRPFIPFQMSETAFDNWWTKWTQVALHFVTGIPLILAPAWLLTGSSDFLLSCTAALALVAWLLAHVHGCIHTPKNRWIERQAWFQWLNHHHYIHHVDVTANINFGLPICDFLLGTQKWELTAQEAQRFPDFETATQVHP